MALLGVRKSQSLYFSLKPTEYWLAQNIGINCYYVQLKMKSMGANACYNLAETEVVIEI